MKMKLLDSILVFLFPIAVAANSGLRPRLLSRRASKFSACARNDVGLSLENAEISINNLGGAGPDTELDQIIKIENIGKYNKRKLDIEISIKEGADYYGFETRNGLLCGIDENGNPTSSKSCDDNPYPFGQVSLGYGKNTTLVFEIKDHKNGKSVKLPAFIFSVFDIDTGGPTQETYVLKDWSTVQYNEEKEFDLSLDPTDYPEYCDGNEKCLVAKSEHKGHGCDNPYSPMDLGVVECKIGNVVNQELRSFQVVYKNKSRFEVVMDFPSTNPSGKDGGRMMVWAFNSHLSHHCEKHDECES